MQPTPAPVRTLWQIAAASGAQPCVQKVKLFLASFWWWAKGFSTGRHRIQEKKPMEAHFKCYEYTMHIRYNQLICVFNEFCF